MPTVHHIACGIAFTCLSIAGNSLAATSCYDTDQSIPLSGKSCAPLQPPSLSCAIPADVQGNLSQPNYNVRQRASDIFAWQDFIALNWPASTHVRGEPDADAPFNAPGPRVWETWKEQYEVYNDDGSAPAAWNSSQPIPVSCGTNSNLKLLSSTGKVNDVLDESIQAVKADGTLPATLVDQSQRLVHYEIRFNQTLFDYIVSQELYNGQKQADRTTIEFPAGSMLVKAAWRQLDQTQATQYAGKFHIQEACFCDDDRQQCQAAPAALVGFHIMHKTPSAPQSVWSTFEHIANVTPTHGLPASFNNPNCTGPHCTPNTQTNPPTPNQLTRVIPIDNRDPDCTASYDSVDNVVQMNSDIQTYLAGQSSPFQYYELVTAQWPKQTAQSAIANTAFDAFPENSGNTTMESYAQDTSSCIGCHAMARSLRPDDFVSTDFSFTLNNAMPLPAGATCGKFGDSNSASCSTQIISFTPETLAGFPGDQYAATLGHALTQNTYEIIPPPTVGNKLHCGSCHLHAGGDPNAAWWVNMRAADAYPTQADLENRINGCFERSMNGQDLCRVASAGDPGTCATDVKMQALTTYMDWLTWAYTQKHGCEDIGTCPTPARGYPEINTALQGDYVHGGKIFQQKCAFCHDRDGQGRYESNTYFRPALWGDNSFNASAGMGQPSKSSRFLKWNMPYGSGGMLTDQEAWDLACYLDSQPRPGKPNPGVPDDPNCIPATMIAEPAK